MPVNHAFTSAKSDDADATLVRPSNWNAAHTVTLTLPTVVAVGTSATGTSDVTPGLPAGHTTNDILLLFVQSSNQTIAAPAGYTRLGPQNGIGTAAAASSTRLGIFWKRDGGSEAAPTVTDTGDHTLAQIMAIRGCPTSGDPFHFESNGRKTTASTTGTDRGGETTVDNCLVVTGFVHGVDTASAQFSAWTNADLTNVTEQIDVATTDGTGGGIGVATGTKAEAGTFGATTTTEANSTVDIFSTFAMLPADSVEIAESPRGADIQTFIASAGSPVDTWVKPAGAKVVEIIAMSGGGGGGAGGHGGATSARAAGGGGGGGGMHIYGKYRASDLASTLALTPGGGGTAGTAITGGGTGGNGGTGGDTTVVSGSATIVQAYGGAGGIGGGGNATSNNGGTSGAGGGTVTPTATSAGTAGTRSQGWYAGGVSTAGTGTGAAGGSSEYGGAGGGMGGGNATTTANAGGDGGGGISTVVPIAGGAAGGGGGSSATGTNTGGNGGTGSRIGGAAARGIKGTPATSGADSTGLGYGAAGGGGGDGRASGGNAYAGGNGGLPAGGGGGGGGYGANDANSSGAGGAGGDGCIVIITYF